MVLVAVSSSWVQDKQCWKLEREPRMGWVRGCVGCVGVPWVRGCTRWARLRQIHTQQQQQHMVALWGTCGSGYGRGCGRVGVGECDGEREGGVQVWHLTKSYLSTIFSR